mmetsp:Transcript_9197/g.27693  ORF Transcript_9197/g.27693 Transcript_9197/m.27693 type:complete len:567 (+) Transcript_9197:181-1881(+)
MENRDLGGRDAPEQERTWETDASFAYAMPATGYFYTGQYYQHPGYMPSNMPYYVEGNGMPYVMGYPMSMNMYDNPARGRGRRNTNHGHVSGTGSRKHPGDRSHTKGFDLLQLPQTFANGDEAVAAKMEELQMTVVESRRRAETEWQGEEQRVEDALLSGNALEQLSLYVFERVRSHDDHLATRFINLLGVCIFGSLSLRQRFVSSGIKVVASYGRRDRAMCAIRAILEIMKRLAFDAADRPRQQGRYPMRPGQVGKSPAVFTDHFAEVQALISQLNDLRDSMRSISKSLGELKDEEDHVRSFQKGILLALQDEVETFVTKAERAVVTAWSRSLAPFQNHLERVRSELKDIVSRDESQSADESSEGEDAEVSPLSHALHLQVAKESSGRLNEALRAFLSLAEFSVAGGVVPSGTGGVFAAARELAAEIDRIESEAIAAGVGVDKDAVEKKNNRQRRHLRFDGNVVMSSGTQRRHARMKSSPDELLHLTANLDDVDNVEEEESEDCKAPSPQPRQLAEELERIAMEDRLDEDATRLSSADVEHMSTPSSARRDVKREHYRSRSVEDIM